MKNNIRTLALVGSILAVGATAQAQNITASQSASTSVWGSGTSLFETGAAPTTGSGGTSNDNDNWGGNVNGTAGFGALGMAFITSSSGTLGNVQLVLTGGTATFNVELYDMGAIPSGYPGTADLAAPITQINNIGGGAQTQTLPTLAGGVNLLQAGDNFTYNTAAGSVVETLTFGGADAGVTLNASDLYVLSLDPTANADGTWWVRGGVAAAGFNNGEGLSADGVAGMNNFEGKTGANAVRDMDLNVVAAPEPASMTLLGLGALVGTLAVRRRNK